jgi:hypothetical protein
MRSLLICALFSVLAGCADEGDACHAVTNMGFTQCTVTESHHLAAGIYGCHRDDSAAFEVNAVNPAQHPVHVVVCCSAPPFGSCTIRN